MDTVRKLPISVAASCHGPVLRGQLLDDAFTMIRQMAGAPTVPVPGQSLLDEIVAEAMAAAGAAGPKGGEPDSAGSNTRD